MFRSISGQLASRDSPALLEEISHFVDRNGAALDYPIAKPTAASLQLGQLTEMSEIHGTGTAKDAAIGGRREQPMRTKEHFPRQQGERPRPGGRPALSSPTQRYGIGSDLQKYALGAACLVVGVGAAFAAFLYGMTT